MFKLTFIGVLFIYNLKQSERKSKHAYRIHNSFTQNFDVFTER